MVFGDIIGDSKNPNLYERFLNTDEDLSIPYRDTVAELKDLYKQKVSSIEDVLKELSDLEELIIQLRCRQMITNEMKYAITRQYIYARSLFYRKGQGIKDIRIIAGKTTENDIKDPALYEIAFEKMYDAMTKEINKTIQKLNVNVNAEYW